MPCFSLRASRVAPLGNGVHREYLDSVVQLIRNGGLSSSCTSKVFTSGAVLLERQYASKVSCSQLLGTPLSSRLDDRVSESRTLIRIVFFCGAALASMATNRRPACRATILRILKTKFPKRCGCICRKPGFPERFWKPVSQIRCIVLPWRVPHNSFPRWRRFGRTDSPAGHRPSGARPHFVGSQCPQSAPAISVIRPGTPAGQLLARWGWKVRSRT